ncbi:snRNA-activating protein complex subunit 1-like [Apostichopus japonicus]|uniref:snRNA-activating protein complex subunit 1-like n=1 Tax=Stichopus japonicus TaxID=307972 RepID=UPI003AB26915
MEYNSWGMRVFDGLNKDIEQLMDNFVKTGSVRYEGFCQIWQEMNFSLVYCGLKIMEHKREFIEEAFRLAVAYLSPPFDFQQRTGGLYLMYAFYSTQRYQPKLKIRLSLQQWEHLKDIESEFKNQGHLDAAYILMKLKAAKAFIFAYSSKQFCFHKGYVEESSDKMVAEMQRDIEQAFPEDLLRKLHETHHKYQLLKSQLGISENLNHVTSSMAEVIAQRFQDIDGEEDKNGNSSKRSSRSERLAQLKAKSFSFMVDPEEQAASQPSSADDGENPSSSRSKSTVSGTSGRRRAKVPVDPDSRPLVDKLMPVLQKYNISESEDDEQEPKDLPAESQNKLPEIEAEEMPKSKAAKVKKTRKRKIGQAGDQKKALLSPKRKRQSPRKKKR